ncbi:carbohydrate ABC transporter permease [Spirochaeta dissipatitropha]
MSTTVLQKLKAKAKVFYFKEIRQKGRLFNLVLVAILLAFSYVFLYPLLRMITMSIMSQADLLNPEVSWIPQELTFQSYRVAASVLRLGSTFFNTLWFTTILACAQTSVTALTSYAFARFNFRFKRFWFVMVLVSFILPIPVLLIPRIMIFTSFQNLTGIRMFGTIWPQLAMTLSGQGIYSAILILIFYNFFRLIPHSLDEAARIDGANSFQIFIKIFLGLSVPTLFTVFLFSFLWNWNESYITTTFVRGGLRLITPQLAVFDNNFVQMAGSLPDMAEGARINEAYKMAATMISIFPLLLMYTFVQKKFIQGIEQTGITGE